MHAYLLVQLLKYVLEGMAVGIAAYLIAYNSKKGGMKMGEIVGLGLTAAATFAVLDIFAPSVSVGARHGSGFGLGAQTIGFGQGAFAFEGYENPLQGEEGEVIAEMPLEDVPMEEVQMMQMMPVEEVAETY